MSSLDFVNTEEILEEITILSNSNNEDFVNDEMLEEITLRNNNDERINEEKQRKIERHRLLNKERGRKWRERHKNEHVRVKRRKLSKEEEARILAEYNAKKSNFCFDYSKKNVVKKKYEPRLVPLKSEEVLQPVPKTIQVTRGGRIVQAVKKYIPIPAETPEERKRRLCRERVRRYRERREGEEAKKQPGANSKVESGAIQYVKVDPETTFVITELTPEEISALEPGNVTIKTENTSGPVPSTSCSQKPKPIVHIEPPKQVPRTLKSLNAALIDRKKALDQLYKVQMDERRLIRKINEAKPVSKPEPIAPVVEPKPTPKVLEPKPTPKVLEQPLAETFKLVKKLFCKKCPLSFTDKKAAMDHYVKMHSQQKSL